MNLSCRPIISWQGITLSTVTLTFPLKSKKGKAGLHFCRPPRVSARFGLYLRLRVRRVVSGDSSCDKKALLAPCPRRLSCGLSLSFRFLGFVFESLQRYPTESLTGFSRIWSDFVKATIHLKTLRVRAGLQRGLGRLRPALTHH